MVCVASSKTLARHCKCSEARLISVLFRGGSHRACEAIYARRPVKSASGQRSASERMAARRRDQPPGVRRPRSRPPRCRRPRALRVVATSSRAFSLSGLPRPPSTHPQESPASSRSESGIFLALMDGCPSRSARHARDEPVGSLRRQRSDLLVSLSVRVPEDGRG